MSSAKSLLDHALMYSKKGWRVFPCKGKVPLTLSGFKDSSLDEGQIKKWWADNPEANIGIETGERSGIVVLDIDSKNDGFASMSRIAEKEGKLKDTVRAYTANGGYHCYFKYSPDIKSRNGFENGIDIKSDGGYVIAPPSKLSDSQRYTWISNKGVDNELTYAPEWMKKVPEKPVTIIEGTIANGKRDVTLTSFAGTMRAKGASPGAIYAALVEQNKSCSPPLPDSQLAKIADSVGRYEPKGRIIPPDTDSRFWDWDSFVDSGRKDIENTVPDNMCHYHITFLEDALMGIYPGELVVVGADSGVGKTQFANDIAFHNAARKKQVYLFSLEGDSFEVAKREWHKRTVKLIKDDDRIDLDLSYRSFITNIDPNMWAYRDFAAESLKKDFKEYLHVYKRKKALDIETLVETLDEVKDEADLVVIDHLHYFELMSFNEYAEITEILKRIRELMVRIRVPIVLVSHLRRKSKDRLLPDTDDFHGTSNIAKQADTCLLFSRFMNSKDEGAAIGEQIAKSLYPTAIQVAKSRHERPASILGVVDYDSENRYYGQEYELWGVGYEFYKLNNFPKWAKHRRDYGDNGSKVGKVSSMRSDWNDKGYGND